MLTSAVASRGLWGERPTVKVIRGFTGGSWSLFTSLVSLELLLGSLILEVLPLFSRRLSRVKVRSHEQIQQFRQGVLLVVEKGEVVLNELAFTVGLCGLQVLLFLGDCLREESDPIGQLIDNGSRRVVVFFEEIRRGTLGGLLGVHDSGPPVDQQTSHEGT